MPSPTAGQVHVDTALTNMSIAYLQKQEHFIASKVFPNVPVNFRSDRYYTYSRADFNREEPTLRAPGAESSGSGYTVDNTPTYFCDVHAHHKDVDDQMRANSDPAHDPDRAAMAYAMQKMMIQRESNWGSTYFAGGVWTGGDYDGVASSPSTNETIQWSDDTSGDPIGDIRAAKTTVLEGTGYEPNTLVLGQQVIDALVDHSDIVDRVKYSGGVGNGNPARVNAQTLAQLFDLDRVLVAKAVKNTANRGATEASSFILGKKALLVYTPAAPSLMEPSGGYTFSWNGYMGQTNEFGIAIKNFRLERNEVDRIEAQMAYDQKLVSADVGFFWDSIVA